MRTIECDICGVERTCEENTSYGGWGFLKLKQYNQEPSEGSEARQMFLYDHLCHVCMDMLTEAIVKVIQEQAGK